MKGQIHITKADQIKLVSIMEGMKAADERLRRWVVLFEHELDHANVVESHAIPRGTVTLYSRVRLLDLHSGESVVYRLVPPSEANSAAGNLSILAPIGIALLGYGEGDRFECETPGGTRRLLVEVFFSNPKQTCFGDGRLLVRATSRTSQRAIMQEEKSGPAARLTEQHREGE